MKKLILVFLLGFLPILVTAVITPKNQKFKIHFPKESKTIKIKRFRYLLHSPSCILYEDMKGRQKIVCLDHELIIED